MSMSKYKIELILKAGAGWLQQQFPGKGKVKINRTGLIREIILAEVDRCRTYGKPHEDRTLRNFWYSHIKSTLMRGEGITAEQDKWSRQASQLLSAVMSEMVLSGLFKYEDISIVDESRNVWPDKDNPEDKRHFEYKLRPYDDIIVFVEKDTIFKPLKNTCKLYNIALVSGAGYTSTAAIEGVTNELVAYNEQGYDHKYTVLVISDYDSYGFQIAEDFQTRALKLGLNCRVVRIGVDPSHFDPVKMQTDKYPVSQKSDYDKKWVATHGIDGKYGLELDSLIELDGSMQKIRDILVDALETWCPEQTMFDAVREQESEGVDEEGTAWAADKILRDREDPRYTVIDLMEKLVEKVRDSLNEDLNEIEDQLLEHAQKMLEDEDFDDRPDPEEGILPDAARTNQTYVWYNIQKSDLSKKVEKELVEEHAEDIEQFDTKVYSPLIEPMKRLADSLGVEYEDA